jgi:thioredoxin reductase (NADPH)
MNALLDIAIIGAGPTGLATALEAQNHGVDYVVIEKGCLTNSIYDFPTQMVFFTTPELLEIGNMPLVCEREKPNRNEALKYYRKVTQAARLKVHQYEEVLGVSAKDGIFEIRTDADDYKARNVVLSTGYYDNPNLIGVPGEELPHVSHYYTEAHPFFDRDVVVIGGKNSAAEAALELFRSGARVTLLHRGDELGQSIKYWVRPDIGNRIARNEITAHFSTVVEEITPTHVRARTDQTSLEIRADQVFALTGYHQSTKFFEQLGVRFDTEILEPEYNPETYETNVPGVFLAGSIVAGKKHREIFIENGRFHGESVIRTIAARLNKT